VAVVNFQVKEQASNTLVIIYQHVGERLRSDLAKKDIHPSKYSTVLAFIFAVMRCVDIYINLLRSACLPLVLVSV